MNPTELAINEKIKELVRVEVNSVSDEAVLGKIGVDEEFLFPCQQTRAGIGVRTVALDYEGDYFPTDIKGDSMPILAVVVMNARLGIAARLVGNVSRIQSESEALVDSLCNRADCQTLGCAMQRFG